MSIFAKAKKARENKKGFTLVELIVVLVILAILAAALVPALLGWIDNARQKQFVLAARNVVMAAQAVADEAYAAGNTNPQQYVCTDNLEKVEKIADVTGLSITNTNLGAAATPDAGGHGYYTITQATVAFTSEGYNVEATLQNGAWTITKADKATAST